MFEDERAREEQARERAEATRKTLALAEEEPDVRKHVREVGAVIVRTHIVEERKLVEVTLRHEEVTIERLEPAEGAGRRSDGDRHAGREPFREQTLAIPLYEETFEVVKRPRLRETLHIRKTARHETLRVPVDVRREEATIETSGAVEERGGDTTHTTH